MEKTGDIYLADEKGRCVAYWRPVDGSRDVFLCAVESSTCRDHPHLRKMLSEFALEIAVNCKRKAGDSVTFRVREPVVETRSRWL